LSQGQILFRRHPPRTRSQVELGNESNEWLF
jgi:hypothetical protein